MVALVTSEQQSDFHAHFVRDSEFGWGRVNEATGAISFFDSPASPEIVLPSAGTVLGAPRLRQLPPPVDPMKAPLAAAGVQELLMRFVDGTNLEAIRRFAKEIFA